jgi:hypothetical protein
MDFFCGRGDIACHPTCIMPTVDDFIRRFGAGTAVDDSEAAAFLDRFTSTDPDDCEFDKDAMYSGAIEYLGSLPDHDFEEAAQNVFLSSPPEGRQRLLTALMRALHCRGVSSANMAGFFGCLAAIPSDASPGQAVNPAQYAKAANFARRQYPEVMRELVREQPWIMKAMGATVLIGALGTVASRIKRERHAPPRRPGRVVDEPRAG